MGSVEFWLESYWTNWLLWVCRFQGQSTWHGLNPTGMAFHLCGDKSTSVCYRIHSLVLLPGSPLHSTIQCWACLDWLTTDKAVYINTNKGDVESVSLIIMLSTCVTYLRYAVPFIPTHSTPITPILAYHHTHTLHTHTPHPHSSHPHSSHPYLHIITPTLITHPEHRWQLATHHYQGDGHSHQ